MDDYCPACGEPLERCRGHNRNADPFGWMALSQHASGDHHNCFAVGCPAAAQRQAPERRVWTR